MGVNTKSGSVKIVGVRKSSSYCTLFEMDDHLAKLIVKAKLAEQAERFKDMLDCMIEFVYKTTTCLTTEERNLLSVANKNVVGVHRASHRSLQNHLNKMAEDSFDRKIAMDYIKTVEKDVLQVSEQAISVLKHCLSLPNNDAESNVFLLKMKGDYYRYMAEVSKKEGDIIPSDESEKAYNEAMALASTQLDSTHPIRLGLALNFSVFYYEILMKPEKACALAKAAFDEAIQQLDQLSEDSYRDSTLIMQLLRDNLTLWSTEQSDEVECPIENS